jgi:hypothetical protein
MPPTVNAVVGKMRSAKDGRHISYGGFGPRDATGGAAIEQTVEARRALGRRPSRHAPTWELADRCAAGAAESFVRTWPPTPYRGKDLEGRPSRLVTIAHAIVENR